MNWGKTPPPPTPLAWSEPPPPEARHFVDSEVGSSQEVDRVPVAVAIPPTFEARRTGEVSAPPPFREDDHEPVNEKVRVHEHIAAQKELFFQRKHLAETNPRVLERSDRVGLYDGYNPVTHAPLFQPPQTQRGTYQPLDQSDDRRNTAPPSELKTDTSGTTPHPSKKKSGVVHSADQRAFSGPTPVSQTDLSWAVATAADVHVVRRRPPIAVPVSVSVVSLVPNGSSGRQATPASAPETIRRPPIAVPASVSVVSVAPNGSSGRRATPASAPETIHRHEPVGSRRAAVNDGVPIQAHAGALPWNPRDTRGVGSRQAMRTLVAPRPRLETQTRIEAARVKCGERAEKSIRQRRGFVADSVVPVPRTSSSTHMTSLQSADRGKVVRRHHKSSVVVPSDVDVYRPPVRSLVVN